MGERRLLMPYLQARSVGCSELVVEMTPNFYLHVSSPGVDPQRHRSATASHFAAALELVKEGKLELRQSETFSPILLRRKATP